MAPLEKKTPLKIYESFGGMKYDGMALQMKANNFSSEIPLKERPNSLRTHQRRR